LTTATPSQSTCARIIDRLVESVGPRKFRMWFDGSAQLNYYEQPPRFEVAVPNQFVANWIRRHFQQALREALRREVVGSANLDVRVEPQRFENEATKSNATSQSCAEPPQTRVVTQSRPQILRHRLESFVIGPSNELAYATAMGLAIDEDSHVASSPLFIHGGCGLGKTHLLQGICRRMLELRSDARVLYTTAEQFTNDYVMAVRTNGMDSFRKRIRKLDMLAVDDVHFLANKQATQQEFLHSFDAIHLSGARLGLASDNHPKLIKQFSEQLVNRCMRGMVVEVRPPDTETRIRIIRSLAAERGISLLNSVINALANHCRGSVREIEGTLTKLHVLANIAERHCDQKADDGAIGHALLNQMLKSELEAPRKIIRFETIIRVVCEHMHVTKNQLQGRSRLRDVVLARALVVHLARRMTAMSFPEIAADLHRSNHSTVVTAAKRVATQLSTHKQVVVPGTLETLQLAEWIEQISMAIRRG